MRGPWRRFSCGSQFAPLGKAADAYVATAALILGASLIETSYVLAYHDELTGIRGRRAFNESLLSLDQQYAIAIVDIDHFKKFNDTYGHDVGDQVLCMVASRLSQVGGDGQAFPLRRRRVRHRLSQHLRQRSLRASGRAAPDHREIHVSGARFRTKSRAKSREQMRETEAIVATGESDRRKSARRKTASASPNPSPDRCPIIYR